MPSRPIHRSIRELVKCVSVSGLTGQCVKELGMLTRLEKISQYRALNFLLSRSAINSWTDDRRLFNDGRYANPPAGGLRVSWELVNRVGSLDGN